MIFSEWNWDKALEVAREEGREDGIEEGIEKGREEGMERGRQYFLEMINQGLTIEEIKERLNQKEAVFSHP